MGFLDNSTNNIILDAVLTDVGRQFLARNDGSFSIVKFALGDDEVDYTTIQKYGRTVGKDKIEKNTPIFEAQTGQNIGLKYPLKSISNPYLVYLPNIELTTGATNNIVTLSLTSQGVASANLRVEQTIQESQTIDTELIDSVYLVKMNNRFLRTNSQVTDIDTRQVATYLLGSTSRNSQGGAQLDFTINAQSLTDDIFTVYGTTTNKKLIKTYVTVTGLTSGAVTEFEVQITKQ